MSGIFFIISFLKFQSRLGQKACRQNEIKDDFRIHGHSIYQTIRVSFIYHEFSYEREQRG